MQRKNAAYKEMILKHYTERTIQNYKQMKKREKGKCNEKETSS